MSDLSSYDLSLDLDETPTGGCVTHVDGRPVAEYLAGVFDVPVEFLQTPADGPPVSPPPTGGGTTSLITGGQTPPATKERT